MQLSSAAEGQGDSGSRSLPPSLTRAERNESEGERDGLDEEEYVFLGVGLQRA